MAKQKEENDSQTIMSVRQTGNNLWEPRPFKIQTPE
jgi:hypothetical protein